MVVEVCAFTTGRLLIHGWHALDRQVLEAFVRGLLTPAVTSSLPRGWGGPYDEARASHWIDDRDAEGTTLVAIEEDAPVGLLLLYETPVDGGVEIRLGYLLAERAWGRGLASELLAGLVGWSRGQPKIRGLVAGVADDNPASIRVLERCGFMRLPRDEHSGERERVYRLDPSSRSS